VGDEAPGDVQRLADELRRRAFEDLARRYANDARSDFRRGACFAAVATLVGATAAVWGALIISSADDGLAGGVVVSALFLAVSTPLWWQADRSRRSGLENRRLQRHAVTLEPFLDGFDAEDRATIRSSLAQVFFSRTFEDADPFRALSFPTLSDTAGAAEVSEGVTEA
jgi:hypothetical protein